MTSRLWRMYADRLFDRWEKTVLWDMIEPYSRPKTFTPLVAIYVAAFYTGVVGSAVTEQLHKEKFWEEHPGEAVPLMRPKFYWGPWKVNRGEVLPPNQSMGAAVLALKTRLSDLHFNYFVAKIEEEMKRLCSKEHGRHRGYVHIAPDLPSARG